MNKNCFLDFVKSERNGENIVKNKIQNRLHLSYSGVNLTNLNGGSTLNIQKMSNVCRFTTVQRVWTDFMLFKLKIRNKKDFQ